MRARKRKKRAKFRKERELVEKKISETERRERAKNEDKTA